MTDLSAFIDPTAPPSGDGCVECDATGAWWVRLRRCALCGHIRCATTPSIRTRPSTTKRRGIGSSAASSPAKSGTGTFEAGAWAQGPSLRRPRATRPTQSVPGPAEQVPANWRELLAAKRGEG